MKRTEIIRWVAGSLTAVALMGLGVTATVVNAQADPTKPTPAPGKDTPTMSRPASENTASLPPEKVAWAEQEARDRAENAAKDADPANWASAMAEKERIMAEASAMMSAAPPLTVRDVCDEGALAAEAPPGTHPDTFMATGGWAQVVGNECLKVYVGWAGIDHPGDGAVYLWHTRDQANAPGKAGAAPAWGVEGVQQIDVPGSGALTVQSVGPGGKLYLTSASGQTYTVLGMANQVKPGRG